MMNSVIRFGTSGWRGIIAEEFTFANVRVATEAIAHYLKEELNKSSSGIYNRKPLVLIGFDARFAGREFALTAAELLERHGMQPLMVDRDTPTPVLAHAIRARKAIAAVNLTASHNPPMYQGLKLSLSNGAGAPKEVTRIIELSADRLVADGWTTHTAPVGSYQCRTFDPGKAYFGKIRKLVDFTVLKRAKLKLAVDFMYGTGRGYLDTLLTEEAGLKPLCFHADRNPLFGGRSPEPNAEGMADVRDCILRGEARLGLGLDGDADRFGIVDRDGSWLTPNQVLALTLYHLKKNRGWSGAAVRTVPTSHQIDAVGELLGVKVYETPVGFKYIGALMESEPIIVGGEESGGLSVKGHVPEKDGILACLLMAELVATERKSLQDILANLEKQIGPFFTTRINVAIPAARKEALLEQLGQGFERIGNFPVRDFIKKDGFKFLLPNQEWVAFRASGTEPVFRCYIEARSEKNLKKLISACKKLLQ